MESSEKQGNQEVEELYDRFMAKLSKLCEEADEELSQIVRHERETNDEPA